MTSTLRYHFNTILEDLFSDCRREALDNVGFTQFINSNLTEMVDFEVFVRVSKNGVTLGQQSLKGDASLGTMLGVDRKE